MDGWLDGWISRSLAGLLDIPNITGDFILFFFFLFPYLFVPFYCGPFCSVKDGLMGCLVPRRGETATIDDEGIVCKGEAPVDGTSIGFAG